MRWTWFVESDGECWSETFDSPAEAIAAMAERQNIEAEHIPARMAQVGIFLASVRITVTPLMVLRPHGEPGLDPAAFFAADAKDAQAMAGAAGMLDDDALPPEHLRIADALNEIAKPLAQGSASIVRRAAEMLRRTLGVDLPNGGQP